MQLFFYRGDYSAEYFCIKKTILLLPTAVCALNRKGKRKNLKKLHLLEEKGDYLSRKRNTNLLSFSCLLEEKNVYAS